jgi:hypothetical protein
MPAIRTRRSVAVEPVRSIFSPPLSPPVSPIPDSPSANLTIIADDQERGHSPSLLSEPPGTWLSSKNGTMETSALKTKKPDEAYLSLLKSSANSGYSSDREWVDYEASQRKRKQSAPPPQQQPQRYSARKKSVSPQPPMCKVQKKTPSVCSNSVGSRFKRQYAKKSAYVPKVYGKYNISERISCRTGYMDGRLLARLSDCPELDEERCVDPDSKSAVEVPRSRTVMLTGEQLRVLQVRYPSIYEALMSGDVYSEFILQPPQASQYQVKLDPTIMIEDGRVVLRSWLPVLDQTTDGKVCFTKEEFIKLGEVLNYISAQFRRFPEEYPDEQISDTILEVSASTLLNLIVPIYGPVGQNDIRDFSEDFRNAYFRAYNEILNFGYTTAMIDEIEDIMAEAGLETNADIYTWVHQTMNQQPLLLKRMMKIV